MEEEVVVFGFFVIDVCEFVGVGVEGVLLFGLCEGWFWCWRVGFGDGEYVVDGEVFVLLCNSAWPLNGEFLYIGIVAKSEDEGGIIL